MAAQSIPKDISAIVNPFTLSYACRWQHNQSLKDLSAIVNPFNLSYACRWQHNQSLRAYQPLLTLLPYPMPVGGKHYEAAY